MVNKYLVPSGFKDSLTFDSYAEHKYNNIIIKYFRENGFTLIKTPLIEFSDNLNKNTLQIKTKMRSEKLSIRNDITPQVKRVASSRLAKKKRPLKLCYYGEVVRKTGTILRPERQFQQVGAEIIGSKSFKADVEIINLAYESLKKIGVKNIVIDVSAPFFIENLTKKVKNLTKRNSLKKFIKLKDLKSSISLLDNIEDQIILKKIYNCSGPIKNKKKELLSLVDTIGYKKEVNTLLKIAELIKVDKGDMINIDLFEIQNEKYYEGLKFVFFASGVRGEIARGGRYLLKYNDNLETATGFACFMDTILRASSFENKNKRILIPFNTPKKIKKSLINNGYSIFTSFDENVDLKLESREFNISYYLKNNKIKKS